VRIEIRRAASATVLEPSHAALHRGAVLEIGNATGEAHLISLPSDGIVRRIEPGGAAELQLGADGEHEIYLLDRRDAAATVFAAPGPFAVVADDGRFELPNLEPGLRELHVWHPRFPPAARSVELAAGSATRIDLELGVGRMQTQEESP
jgi:hypothetical protein